MTARIFSRADLAELIDLYADALEECAVDVDVEQAKAVLEGEVEIALALHAQASTLRMVAVAMRRGMIGELHASTLQEIRSLPEVHDD